MPTAGSQSTVIEWAPPRATGFSGYVVLWQIVAGQPYNRSIAGAGDITGVWVPANDRAITIYNLLPNVRYRVCVIAYTDREPNLASEGNRGAILNDAVQGEYGSSAFRNITGRVSDPTQSVQNARVASNTVSEISLQWDPPNANYTNGRIESYRVNWTRSVDTYADPALPNVGYKDFPCCPSDPIREIDGLEAGVTYEFTVTIKNQDRSDYVMPIAISGTTQQSEPTGGPQIVVASGASVAIPGLSGPICATEAQPGMATVSWTEPAKADLNGAIVEYEFGLYFTANSTLAYGPGRDMVDQFTFDDSHKVVPNTTYTLRIAARTAFDTLGGACSNCWGPEANCSFRTSITAADSSSSGGESGGNGGMIVAVIIIIVLIAVAIGWVYWRTRKDLPLVPESISAAYRTHILKKPPKQAGTVPDRGSNGYGTGGAAVQDPRSMYDETAFNGGVGSDRGLKIPPPPVLPPVQTHPVNVDDLANTIVQMSANSDFAFSEEYECLETGNEFSREAAQLYENKMKNRYANILAYDYTRVRLTLMPDDPFSDYINANYIDGHGEVHKRKYIAAQGPTAMTVIDFWRMLYETDSNVVIMVTNCEEKGRIKCHRYWPTALNEEMPLLDNFSVVLEHVEEYPDFVIRKVRVKFEGVQRIMHQFHYTSWPDHGVPESTAGILMMLRKARAKKGPGPMAVHCSAGVGRTGTLIAIDHNIDRADAVGNVDVFQCLNMMRRQRNTMVQTEEQYIFIYRALLDSLSSVNTEMTEAELRAHFRGFTAVGKDGMSPRDKEFKKLADITPNKDMRTDSAQVLANKAKNRFQNIMPFEHTRLKLTPLPGVLGSDYVNANLIDGHKQKGAYIATQGPLEETAADFWRMIWDRDIDVVVMLTSLIENGREQSFQYWPDRADDGKVTFGDHQISLNMELDVDYGFERTFTVTELVSETSRTVKQCQFTKWPKSNGDAVTGTPMVSLVRAVKMHQDSKVVAPLMSESIYGNASAINEQDRQSQTKPIVVHCNAGVGRTGAFCAFHINLKKMEEDGKVDVFSTVKHLRTQRMTMVQTPDQYECIFKMLVDVFDAGAEQFSDSNNLYANVGKQTLTLKGGMSKAEMAGLADTVDFEEEAPPPIPTKRSAKTLSRSGSIVKYDDDEDGFAV